MRWSIPYWRGTVSASWITAQLAEHGVVCEFFGRCKEIAVDAYMGPKEVLWLCLDHSVDVNTDQRLATQLENYNWDRFDAAYNYVRQVHDSHGAILEKSKAQLDREDARAEKANARTFVAEVKKAGKQIKPGMPDDDLAVARGAQSPSLSPIQVVFRESGDLVPFALFQPSPAEGRESNG